MNEAETRAEHIDPALKLAGWGVGKEGTQPVTNCHRLKMAAGDSKQRRTASKKGLKRSPMLLHRPRARMRQIA
jgi:type I site-specific restriction endonuclease